MTDMTGRLKADELDELDVAKIRCLIGRSEIGKRIELLSCCGSTNDKARILAEQGAPEGTVVLAESQVAGRGRLERRWFSPRGGLWFTIILRPYWGAEFPSLFGILPLAIGLGVCEGLEAQLLKQHLLGIKWPNDIVCGGRKLCGILCQSFSLPLLGNTPASLERCVIAGIGINANLEAQDFPPEVRDSCVSLKMLSGRRVDRNAILASVLASIDRVYGSLRDGASAILSHIRPRCVTLGRTIRVDDGSRVYLAKALEIMPDGSLRVCVLGSGEVLNLYSGDVALTGK